MGRGSVLRCRVRWAVALVVWALVAVTMVWPARVARGDVSVGAPLAPTTLAGVGGAVAPGTRAGFLPGSGGVSSNGAFTYSMPLWVPDGRAGMAPALALEYSSAAGDGPLGLGWSLSGASSAIGRCGASVDSEGTRSGVRFDGGDRYCMDGAKLVGVSGTYGGNGSVYATEDESFSRVVSYNASGSLKDGPDSFEVWLKDGRKRTYSARWGYRTLMSTALTTSQRPVALLPAGGGAIALYDADPRLSQHNAMQVPVRVAWVLTSERDRYGNEMKFSYQDDANGAEYLVQRIDYTFGPNGTPAARRVEFGYETRPDAYMTWVSGVRFAHSKRLTSVSAFAPNPAATSLVRTYTFGYVAGRSRSLLESVRESGALGGKMPARKFVWSGEGVSFASTAVGTVPLNTTDKPAQVVHVLDANDDGLDDVVYNTGGTGSSEWIRMGRRDAAGKPTMLADTWLLTGVGAWPKATDGLSLAQSRPVDINGGGGPEFALRYNAVGGQGLHSRIVRWYQNGHTFIDTGVRFDEDSAWDDFADLNGDGRADHITALPSVTSENTLDWNRPTVAVQLNQGGSAFGPLSRTEVSAACAHEVGDPDGDGRAEALIEQPVEADGVLHCGVGNANDSGTRLTDALEVDDAAKVTVTPGFYNKYDGEGPAWRLPPLNPQSANYLSAFPNRDNVLWWHDNAVHGWKSVRGDFNGDGLADTLLVPTIRSCTPLPQCWDRSGAILWNTGNGLYWDGSTVSFYHDPLADIRTADVDGDGRDDLVVFADTALTTTGPDGRPDTTDDVVETKAGGVNQITAHLSQGNGRFREFKIADGAGTPHTDPAIGRPWARLGDFNGDGRTDVLKNDGGTLSVIAQTTAEPVDRITAVLDEDAAIARQDITYGQAWTDRADLIAGGSCAPPLICSRHGMSVVRRLTSYENFYTNLSTDGSVTTHYSYANPVAHARQGFLGFGMVRAWTPARGSETVTTYDVTTSAPGGRYYPFAPLPKEVLTKQPALTAAQLAQQPATAPAKITRTRYGYTFTGYHNGASHAVLPTSTHTAQWLQTVHIDWPTNLAGSSQTEHLTWVFDSEPPSAQVVNATRAFDPYGNTTTAHTATTGGITEDVVNTYDLSDTRINQWLTGLCTHTTVTRAEADADPPAVTRSADYHYDPVTGVLDQVDLEPGANADPATQQTTQYGRDPLGVTRTITTQAPNREGGARVDHIEYGTVFAGQPDERIYPSQTWTEYPTPKYRPTRWVAVQPAFGITVATEDANGVISRATFDDLGRVLQTSADGQPTVHAAYAAHTTSTGKINGVTLLTIVDTGQNGSTATNTTTTVLDQLGRTRETTSTGFTGTRIQVGTSYDTLGRVSAVERPHESGTAAAGSTRYAYDTLDRPLVTTLPDGHTRTTSYQDLDTTTSIDERGNRTDTVTDVDGRPVKAVAYRTTVTSTGTTYTAVRTSTTTYAPFDLPATIIGLGSTQKYAYDVRGRVVRAEDPDRGVSTISYYGTGEIKTATHLGSGDTVTYHHDVLGRLTKHDDKTAAGTTSTTLTWDTAPGGIGRLASTTSPDGISTAHRYDGLGRPTGTDYTITGDPTTPARTTSTYSTQLSYDALGRPETLAYPEAPGRGRPTLKTSYNNYGYATDLTDITPGQTATAVQHITSRNSDMALTGATFGNGGTLIQTNSYDPLTGRPTGRTTTGGGTTLQNLGYTYHDNGLVKTRGQMDATTGNTNRVETYDYDELDQLTGWTLATTTPTGTTTSKTTRYSYDAGANLTQPDTETRKYGDTGLGAGPHALATLTRGSGTTYFHYDSRGRETHQTNAAGATLRSTTYTPFDLPRTITTTTGPTPGTTTFRYDALGNRITKSGPDGTTLTLAGLYEKRTTPAGATTHAWHLTGPTGRIGQLTYTGTTSTTEYTLTDTLGSTNTATTAAGTITQKLFYEPFGARITLTGASATAPGGNITHGFTGHNHDDALGLINMNGRLYNPDTKTFTTPDPVTANHPYSYVNNTPLNATDPTGLDPSGDFSCDPAVCLGFADSSQPPAPDYTPNTSATGTYTSTGTPNKSDAAGYTPTPDTSAATAVDYSRTDFDDILGPANPSGVDAAIGRFTQSIDELLRDISDWSDTTIAVVPDYVPPDMLAEALANPDRFPANTVTNGDLALNIANLAGTVIVEAATAGRTIAGASEVLKVGELPTTVPEYAASKAVRIVGQVTREATPAEAQRYWRSSSMGTEIATATVEDGATIELVGTSSTADLPRHLPMTSFEHTHPGTGVALFSKKDFYSFIAHGAPDEMVYTVLGERFPGANNVLRSLELEINTQVVATTATKSDIRATIEALLAPYQ